MFRSLKIGFVFQPPEDYRQRSQEEENRLRKERQREMERIEDDKADNVVKAWLEKADEELTRKEQQELAKQKEEQEQKQREAKLERRKSEVNDTRERLFPSLVKPTSPTSTSSSECRKALQTLIKKFPSLPGATRYNLSSDKTVEQANNNTDFHLPPSLPRRSTWSK